MQLIKHLVFISLFVLSPQLFCQDKFDDILHITKIRKISVAQQALDKYKLNALNDNDGKVHLLQGIINFELYQFNSSLHALSLARDVLEASQSFKYLGHTYFYLGRLFRDGFSNSEQARFFYDKAISAYQQLANFDEDIANTNFQIARTFPFSDLEKRAHYNGLAIAFFEKNPVRYSIELAECYNLNALLLFYQNRQSENWKKEFLKTISLIESKPTDHQFNLGKYYDNLGFCISQVDEKTGYGYLQKGLRLNRSFEFNRYWVTSSLNNLGSYFEMVGELDKALMNYREVVDIRKEIYGESEPEVALGYNHMAIIFLKKSEIDSSLLYFSKAIDAFGKTKDSSQLNFSPRYSLSYAFALKDEAEAFQKQYERLKDMEWLKRALKDLQEGSKIIGENYSNFELETSKIAYIGEVRSLFLKRIEIAQLLFQQTHYEKYLVDGLEAMEFLRYASAFENHVRVRNSYSHPKLKNQINRQLQLKSELMLLRAIGDNGKNSEKIAATSSQLFPLSDSLKSMGMVDYSGSRSIQEIFRQRKEKHSKNVVVEYQDFGDSYFIICLSPIGNTFTIVRKPDDWDNSLNEFFRLVGNSPNIKNFDADRKKFVQLSVKLFDILIRPIENLFTQDSPLIIIPDGVLNNLPFEVLIDHANENNTYQELDYLFKRYKIENSFSLRLYAVMLILQMK